MHFDKYDTKDFFDELIKPNGTPRSLALGPAPKSSLSPPTKNSAPPPMISPAP